MTHDCILFNCEVDLLEIRLNVLKDVVDNFIVIESRHTHSGREKEPVLPMHADRFSDFPVHYALIEQPGGSRTFEDSFGRESEQREASRELLLLHDVTDSDIVLMGDLDEVPDPELLDALVTPPETPSRIGMRHFYWWLNAEDSKQWDSGTVIMSGRDAVIARFDHLRVAPNLPVIPGADWYPSGGWHFSSVGTVPEIVTKLEGFIHVEYGGEVGKSLALNRRERFQSIHGQPLRQVEIDDTFPEYLQDNQDRYSHLIRNGD